MKTRTILSIPSSMTEFVQSPWYPKLFTLVKNFRLNDPVEDVVNDILLDMLEKGYIERWDSSMGSFSNWIYTFSGNVCKKKYNRSHTNGGTKIEYALSIENSPDSEDSFRKGVVFEDMLEGNMVEDGGFNLFLGELREILTVYKASSSNVFDGIEYSRDSLTVLELLLKDYSVKEIAEAFGTSIEFIYILIRRIRSIIKRVYGLGPNKEKTR